MDYEQFITEIKKYWDLRKKGLKKQANSFLFTFTKSFKENVPDADTDAILFQFCREYLDEMKFPGDSHATTIYAVNVRKIKCRRCVGHIRFLETVITHMIQCLSMIFILF